MPTAIANIVWDPIAGSTGTLVEYKKSVDSIWITPVSPTNPTLLTTYSIIIDVNVSYDVRLTRYGARCSPKSTTFQIIYPSSSCCPATYTLAPDGSYCYKEDTVPAIPPAGSPLNLVAASNAVYSSCGSYYYSPGYNINGTGTSTQISLSNTFWVNGPGDCNTHTTTLGPLNRSGVWASTTSSNQDIGFGVCLNIPVTKTYLIGIASDNFGIIKLDSNIIVQQDEAAINAQYGGTGICFKVWHIYPVVISSGPHILELLGHNIGSAASLGCEIYDATTAELIAATSYGDLGSKLIFSSKDYIGQPVQIGTGNAGYTCPSGYALSTCDSPIICRRILTTPTISC